LGFAFSAVAASAPPLTTLHAIRALSNAEASHQLPVAFPATVTYIRGVEHTLFLQDGDQGIYVRPPADADLHQGDLVLVHGQTHESFNPFVLADQITVLGHAALPQPVVANFDSMIGGKLDCRMVTVRGIVRTANEHLPLHYADLQIVTEGGFFSATVDDYDADNLGSLLDAEVEITGVASEQFDSKMQVTGIIVHLQSPAAIKILRPATSNPWSLPATPMDRVLASYSVHEATARVRVHGTITYYRPGFTAVLQDGGKSIWIETETRIPLRIGDQADATGFAEVRNGFLNLTHGEIRDSFQPAPVTPLPATWQMLTSHGNVTTGHQYDLVSIEGQVVAQVREASQDVYVLSADGKLFSAIYRLPDGPPPATREIPLGSRVRVTGICVPENSSPFVEQVPFNILMRSPDDVAIVARPSWLSIRNLIRVVGGLLLVVLGVTTWGWMLTREVWRKTAALAARTEAETAREHRLALIEHRRSTILEEINGTVPLAGILEEIAEMVSFCLDGAPCWCEVTDGARLGACSPPETGRRLNHAGIYGRTQVALGTLFASLPADCEPSLQERDTLSMAARLAALAIETRRLYSDLLHRSEFDLLTEIHNRFSLERYLDACILNARQNASAFGLIYIDLDDFKQVNDRYGHRVGDLFLQEVSLRLKKLLRSGDMLARLGGDEFALLLPGIHVRADIIEVAHRIEHCFQQPLQIDTLSLPAAVSTGIALYPEDGASRDALLRTADEAMYACKNARRRDKANRASALDDPAL
jgi:diguanylate cyclase (GGDEF)-like protein